MATDLHILGIRHHGPGSARMVERALSHLKPDAVLIEGPADAADALPMASHTAMRPPVALLVYQTEEPSDAALYPFVEYSPEWRAIRWALANKVVLRFIDLTPSRRAKGGAPDLPETEAEQDAGRAEPLEELARAAGFEDGEAWWGRLIEERRGDDDPLGVFDTIREAMEAVRATLGSRSRDPDEPAREAHMRRSIRAAVKEGFERITVVCGAWHAPALTSEAIKATTAKADDKHLKGLPRRKTAATWVPWTHGRMSLSSGYGAGIASPGWYEHLWLHPGASSTRWMTSVARLMRDEGLDASPAHAIEAARLADSLAALRGRSAPGLAELDEATLSVVCGGNPLPMRVIERRLIVGERLGGVPEDAPAVPLQRDLTALQKSLRLKVSADDLPLDLDLRKELDLARSHLLHRLGLLGVEWGKPRDERGRKAGTFHEFWVLQWHPEFAIKIVEGARHGNTVERAAAGCAIDLARSTADLPVLTRLLDQVVLAELPAAMDALVARIQAVSAVSADVVHLMEAVPPLARTMRYGNVRRTDAELLAPVLAGFVARICAGLGPACSSVDDDAAARIRTAIDAVESALGTLNDAALLDPWRERLRLLGNAGVHGLIAGRSWRLLLDAGATEPEQAANRLSLALSRGNEPAAASAWLEGFLSGAGTLLVHDRRLLGIVDQWVTSLPADAFAAAAPIARRTFADFEPPERRAIGEAIRAGAGLSAAASAGAGDGEYDAARAELVMPVLRLILGEDLA